MARSWTRTDSLRAAALLVALCWAGSAGAATLEGLTFLDLEADGSFSESHDRRLAGIELRLQRLGADGPTPTGLRTVSDREGRYSLAVDRVAAGRFQLAILSDRGAFLGRTATVLLDPRAERVTADVPVVPSGIVYDSESGAPVPGARLWLYRRQPDGRPGELLQDSDLSGDAGLPQQGQATGAHGLYRFDMPAAGPLLLRVEYPGAAYVAPSRKRPPVDGVAPGGPASSLPYPDAATGSDWRYYLRFDPPAGGDRLRNNHIPLDPASRLLVPTVRASRTVLRSGDVVTWTVELANRTGVDLLGPGEADAASGQGATQGGLFVQDALPVGFKYLPRTARLEVLRDQEVVRGSDADPAGATVLRFADMRRGQPQPLSLRSGETLRLRYQTVAGLDARPGQRYRSRVRILGASDEPLSPEIITALTVEPDALFDLGLLMAKVYCDSDSDGWQDPGEAGVPGVRLFVDTGHSAATDAGGQLSLTKIPPGNHLVKLDTDTLPPGSELLTPAARVFSFTAGLPHKHSWAVRCGETAAPPVVLNPHLRRQAEQVLLRRAVRLAGDVGGQTLRVAGRPVELLHPRLAGSDGRSTVSLRLNPQGRPLAANVLLTAGHAGAEARSWSLWLGGDALRSPVELAAGEDAPPAQVVWTGRSSTGGFVQLRPGRRYALWLETTGAYGQWARSASVHLDTEGADRAPSLPEEVLRGDLFAPAGEEPSPTLIDHLRRVRAAVVVPGRRVVIEVHEAAEQDPAAALALSQGRAARAAAAAARAWGMAPERCVGVGRGASDPLVPNIGARNRWTNQRVVLRSVPFTGADGSATEGGAGQAFADGQRLPVDADGRFDVAVLRPQTRALVVELRGARGAAASVRIPEPAADARRTAQPAAEAAVLVQAHGSLRLRQLEVGGVRVRTPLLGLAAPQLGETPGGQLVAQLTAPAVDVARWRVVVRTAAGQLVEEAGGRKRPPRQWRLPAGALRVVDEATPICLQWWVEARSGDVGWSASDCWVTNERPGPTAPRLTRWEGGPELSASGSVRLGGRPLEIDAQGRFKGSTVVSARGAVVVEVRGPDGDGTLLRIPAAELVDVEAVPTEVEPRGGAASPADLAEPTAATTAPAGATLAPEAPTGPPAAAPEGGPPEAQPSGPPEAPAEAPTAPALAPRRGPGGGGDLDGAAVASGAFFGAAELERLLPLAPPMPVAPADVSAGQIVLRLPPRGSLLHDPRLRLTGTTHPDNQVWVNGQAISSPGGRIDAWVDLPAGRSDLLVETKDPDGNRGEVRWPLLVARTQHLLLAIADGAAGDLSARMDYGHTGREVADGTLFVGGRAALLYKGRISGALIFDELLVTAHLDTERGRAATGLIKQLVDPGRDYAVYGDASEERQEATTAQRLYVLVEADESSAIVGAFETRVEGIELVRYDRVLDGARAHLEREWSPGWRTKLAVFGAEGSRGRHRAHDELLGTGGSLYYLRHRELISGTEQVRVVVRDRDTGRVLEDRRLTRDQDYELLASEGRVLLKRPLASNLSGGLLPGPSTGARTLLAGHDAYLIVDYEHQGSDGDTEDAWGADASQEIAGVVELGASHVQEGSSETGYRLRAARARVRPVAGTSLEVELASTRSASTPTAWTVDGGLGYGGGAGAQDPAGSSSGEGDALHLQLESDLSLALGTTATLPRVAAYYQRVDEGFSADGALRDQGTRRMGAQLAHALNQQDHVLVRHDSREVGLAEASLGQAVAGTQRRSTLQYRHEAGGWGGVLQYDHLIAETDSPPPAAAPGAPMSDETAVVSNGFSGGLRYALSSDVSLSAQQAVVQGGPQGDDASLSDRLTSTFGLSYRVIDDLQIELAEAVRWSGETATLLGLSDRLEDGTSVYLRERLDAPLTPGRSRAVSVVGAQRTFGPRGRQRAYSEYQLDGGASAGRGRAVVGLGRRWDVQRWIWLDTAFEHAQLTHGAAGVETRDALSLGGEALLGDEAKLSVRYELRYQDQEEAAGGRDLRQIVGLHRALVRLVESVTLLGRVDVSETRSTFDDTLEARSLEAVAGLAYRPPDSDWFHLLVQYGHVLSRDPLARSDGRVLETDADVISVVPVFDTPWRLQFVEKAAFRRQRERALDLAEREGDRLLLIQRINWHVWGALDLGGEWRFRRDTLSDEFEHGLLAEVAYVVGGHVRLATGYNFTSFGDNEFLERDREQGGAFVRVTGQY